MALGAARCKKPYHAWAFEDADLPGATSSAKQPAALAWARRLWAD
jgi:hypothetical protein